jgi:flagellar basal-body rod protein FlgB
MWSRRQKRIGKEAMHMQVETLLSDQIARYVDLAASEAKLTAANMANIDTPGYRAVGMDFVAEMREAMSAVDHGRAARQPRVKLVDGLIARPDGNDVSMDRESLNLAEAQLKFKTGVALLKGSYQQIMDAIHVQDK